MPPRLKSLELHGYKTFASRTLFEFPGMVTSIVGPNGSGKSNIADSLRWVLGEQSYTLLRGKKTEDMIFTGSEQRPRAGMASSTIVFDNADGWLPIDYSEVAITRRAYRDGNNEYLLNGQRVRLREISELLAQSGLSERTYTIVGQGMVDAALALKPEERRRLFEEAAGIGLFRARKEESLHRLENTRRNLERVQDILAELEPRLRSLEKQARRANEYEQVKTDLRVLLRDWYGYHWNNKQQELNHVRSIMEAQDENLEQARQRQNEVSGDLAVARGEMQALRSQLNGWYAQSSQVRGQLEKVGRDLAILDERQRSLAQQRQNLLSDQARLEEEFQSQSESLNMAVTEKDRLNEDLEDADNQADASRKKLLERQVERARVEKQLREARQELTSTETRRVQLRAHRSELANRLENLQKSLASVVQGIENAQSELEKAKARQDQASQERQAADAARKAAEANLQERRQAIQAAESELKKLTDDRSRLEAEKARYQAQLDVLEQADRTFSGYAEGARSLLQAVKQGRLKGNYTALSALLEVPAEYEAAVGAALGEYLDLILLENADDPEPALAFLEGGEKGRVAVLPLDWVNPDGGLTIPTDEDVVGAASDLVGGGEQAHKAIRLLLANVVVVRSRSAARRIVCQLPVHARVVTLRGEVFYASGPVVVGQAGRSGTISRPRQKRELQETLQSLETRFQLQKNAIDELQKGLASQRAEEGELLKASRQAAVQAEKALEGYQHATLALEQARRQSDWQTGQRASLDLQVAKTEQELKRVSADVTDVEGRISVAQEQLREQQRAMSALPVEELQAEVAHWETRIAVAERAVKDAVKRVEERRATLERNQQQRLAFQKRLEELAVSGQAVEAEKASGRQLEVGLSEQFQALQVQIEPAEKELKTAEKSYEELQEIEAAAQQALMVAERHATQAQLDLTRQREALESLRRRVEEDFGLVAFEYASTVSGPTPLPFDGMVEELPVIAQLSPGIEETINRQRAQLRRMGAVNPEAQAEYLSVKERFEFMTSQVADLRKADADLRQVIGELDELMKRDFRKTFNAVAIEFKGMFSRLFNGGSARLVMTDEDNPTETGIDIEARLPGRREQGLSLLSGGERSLTAVALVFAIIKVSPTPFCVMDEVDAMLDESNVGRFTELLRELSQQTQFIVVTHNRNTVQVADVIYGITMGRDSASQVISLKLDEISDEMMGRS